MGGAVGLSENPVAFRRYMVAGPEQGRVLEELSPTAWKMGHQVPLNNMNRVPLDNQNSKSKNNLYNTIADMGNHNRRPACMHAHRGVENGFVNEQVL